ncbi:MAG: TetR/AcrR family transcriptional regulator [Anaerolineaceae bacterium]|nr:TetR/AcrR family transcriptional regulator [Anaerolineaceae bacterium]
MRKPRDGQDTRQRVLSSAMTLFAEQGFAGTSLADISKDCGISDGLILHHFQNKKNLYQAVLEQSADEYTKVFESVRESAGSPQAMMQEAMLAAFKFWKEDTSYQRLSLWSYLEGQSGLSEKEAQFTAGMAQMVEQLQTQGMINNQISPVVLMTMVIGPIHFWLRYREQFKETLQLPDALDELDEIFIRQLLQVISMISSKEG